MKIQTIDITTLENTYSKYMFFARFYVFVFAISTFYIISVGPLLIIGVSLGDRGFSLIAFIIVSASISSYFYFTAFAFFSLRRMLLFSVFFLAPFIWLLPDFDLPDLVAEPEQLLAAPVPLAAVAWVLFSIAYYFGFRAYHRSDATFELLAKSKQRTYISSMYRYDWINKYKLFRTTVYFGFYILRIYIISFIIFISAQFAIWIITIVFSLPDELVLSVVHSILGLVLMWLIFRPLFFKKALNAILDFRSEMARTASELFEVDPRPKILFLRSFGADSLEVYHVPRIDEKILGLGTHWRSLESTIVEVAFRFGPVGALQDPSTLLKPLGAARDISSSEHWKFYVLRKLKECQDVIYILGETKGLKWELEQAIELDILDKFIFIFPPGWLVSTGNEQFFELLVSRFDCLSSFEGEPVMLYSTSKDEAVFIVARSPTTQSYTSASLLAFQTRRSNGGRDRGSRP